MKSPPMMTAMAVAAVVLFAGCAGGSQTSNGGTSALPPATRGVLGYMLPSGLDTRAGGASLLLSWRLPSPFAPDKIANTVESEFFISDSSTNVFAFKNSTYKKVGDITSGITASDGVWVDKIGNVYVANITSNVVEYAKGKGSPICTYSTLLTDPVNGTTDNAGNVYVADFEGNGVREYAQCSNSVPASVTVSNPEGIAVDSKGDLFVSFNGSSGGEFEEFTGGKGTLLGAKVVSAAGLILDKNGNLIADDQTNGSIDLIKPPYKSAKVLVSGLSAPFHCALNSKETLLFNANHGSATVTVYKYPSMSLVHTIKKSDGIDGVQGVGESPNAVF